MTIDRSPLKMRVVGAELVEHRLDLNADPLGTILDDVDAVIHCAGDDNRQEGPGSTALLEPLLTALDRTETANLVVLSSATVYGARADNPVPIIEGTPLRPNAELTYAVGRAEAERWATDWAASSDRRLSVFRPTTTVSQHGLSWIASALRSETVLRGDEGDPPVQFLHHDDLASALVAGALGGWVGEFNVAPDGWIGPEAFRTLVGVPDVRVPRPVSRRLRRAAQSVGVGVEVEGLDAYVREPWVVANDKLRQMGWEPRFTNEEAFVVSTPTPPWMMSAKRRQELSLAAAGAGVALVVGALGAAAKRASR